ncbi:MAG TPA: DUF6055 domain-containing protein [bacterium]|nr:DUF6055 domain-containing protein [bacterium]
MVYNNEVMKYRIKYSIHYFTSYISIIILMLLTVSFTFSSPAFGIEESDIVNNFVGIFSPDQGERTAARNTVSDSEITPSATMALIEVVRRWDELSPEAQLEISKYLAIETDSRGETRSVRSVATNGCTDVISKENDASSESEHFKVYYEVSGSHAATGEYVQSVINALEYSWDHEINTLGLPPPILPNGKMDIYICNLTTETGGVLGTTWLIEPFEDNTCSAYIEIDNDFSEIVPFSDFSAEDYMESTIAHEFFHSIQVGMNYMAPSIWMFEISAMWMQEEVFPDNNDYLDEVDLLFDEPDRPIDDVSDSYYYQQHFFLRHLTEHAASPAFVVDMWDNIEDTCADGSSISWCDSDTVEIELMNDMLVDLDTDFRTVYRDFYVANITKDYADGDDEHFPEVKMNSVYFYSNDETEKSGIIGHYASELYSTSASDAGYFLDYDFDGNTSAAWDLSVVCFKSDDTYTVSHYAATAGKASFSSPLVSSETGCSRVVAIVNNTSEYSTQRDFDITFTKSAGNIVEHETAIPAGWSLLGMPVSGGDATPQYVSGLSGAQIFQLKDDNFVYEEEDFDNPAPGMAYWVYLESAATAHFSGFESETGEVALEPGWNFISVPGIDETAWSASTITLKLSGSSTLTPGTTEADEYIDPVLYEYDPGLDPPDYVSYSLEDGHVMVPGKGYIIKAHKTCSLEFPVY